MINSIAMNSSVCIDATGLTSYATEPLAEGASAADRVRAFADSIPGAQKVSVLVDDHSPARIAEGAERVHRNEWNTEVLTEALKEAAGDAEAVVYLRADTPFLDPGVTARMLESHSRYVAEYTFADGYPAGMTPEIVDPRILDQLRTLAAKKPEPVGRDGLFAVVQKDINAFDVETELSPVDLRILRATLACDTRRNHMLCDRVARRTDGSADQVMDLLQEHAEVIRTLPAYTSIQVVEGDVQTPVHSPYALMRPDALEVREEMSVERFSRLVSELAAFAPDGMIHVSLWGEVGLHSDVPALIRTVEELPGMQLIVETSGVGWKQEALEAVCGMALSSTFFIIDLDTDDPDGYRRIRGEGFQEAVRAADTLLEAHGQRVYVQAVRMQETEEQVESFYRNWKERGAGVIVQKYDHFCRRLPDRRVTDISPVERFPCRHTQRDLNVLIDGTVPMCREDLDRTHRLGNVFEDGIEAVWNNGSATHILQVREDYPELCRQCDEYYTFNY
jgi:spiro-SPASM protein